MTDRPFTPFAPLDSLPEGGAVEFALGGAEILLCRSGDTVFAIGATCSHAFQALAGGAVRNGWIACPAHGARFDLATGEPLGPPATSPIAAYAVRVVDGMVEVAV